MLTIRAYHVADAPALLALFRDTIRRINKKDYNPEQIRAWASDDIDPIRWAERFVGRFVVVAESAGILAGFSELEADGHLDRFYVSADHQGCGVGKAMLAELEAEAGRLNLKRLFTEASITARPFFEHHGYRVLQEQTVVVRDVAFINYRMEKMLSGAFA